MQISSDKIINNFLNNLLIDGKSKVSIKNYKSDIAHFLAWAILKLKSFGALVENIAEVVPFIDQHFFNEYKKYMVENNVKIKTTNRRLSSLRSFSRYLSNEHITDQDFMSGIQNVGIGIPSKLQEKSHDIIESFRESLEKDKKASPNTVKNYISDVRGYLDWLADFDKKGELPNGI